MTIKSIVSKELESTVEKMTSQFQKELNHHITKLVSDALEHSQAKKNETVSQESVAEVTQEIAALKLALEDEKNASIEQKQKFQVEITQLKINHSESIEALEYGLEDLQAELLNSAGDNSKQLIKNIDKLNNQLNIANKTIAEKEKQVEDLKQLESKASSALKINETTVNNLKSAGEKTIEKLSTQLNSSMNALEEKQKHLKIIEASEKQAIDKLKLAEKKQQDALTVLDEAKKRLSVLEVNTQVIEQQSVEIKLLKTKLNEAEKRTENAKEKENKLVAEALKEANKKHEEIIEKLQQEQSINAESKLKETSQQQLIELQQKQLKEHLSLEASLKNKVAELTELTEKSEASFVKQQQESVKLHESSTLALKEKLQAIEKEYELALSRTSIAKEKQERENSLVRDTIKSLRHENNELRAQKSVESNELTEQVSLLEQKITEYRLKFEYAQKQITQMAT